MKDVIHLHRPERGEGPQRLNLFAGRHLGEREFDLRQAYADARLQGLLSDRRPGILQGLEVSHDGADGIRVQPGSAVAGDGQALRLFFPLDTTWPDVVATALAAERSSGPRQLDGLYLLTLDRTVYLDQPDTPQQPCTRTEPNPLHDSTLETSAYIGLQAITGLPDLSDMTPSRAANRVCVFHTRRSPFTAGAPRVPLALVQVAKNRLQWLDPVAGRFEAVPDAPYRTLLAHYQTVVDELTTARERGEATQPASSATLAAHLAVDYLPAAGPLPDYLVTEIAGRAAAGGQWRLPDLAFAARDLQIELTPVPVSDVLPTLQRELSRKPIDLVHGNEDRLRVMVAIPDEAFAPNLMDLPQVDPVLADELVARGQVANDHYLYWRYVHDWLFAGVEGPLTDEEIAALGLTLDEEGVVRVPPQPRAPATFYDDLIKDREAALAEGEAKPPPYSLGIPKDASSSFDPPADADYAPFTGTSLYVQADTLARKIDLLEQELDANDGLLGAFDAFLSLQRQQADSTTLSLSNLAGGIPGDGSGLKFLKWAPYTSFKDKGEA